MQGRGWVVSPNNVKGQEEAEAVLKQFFIHSASKINQAATGPTQQNWSPYTRSEQVVTDQFYLPFGPARVGKESTRGHFRADRQNRHLRPELGRICFQGVRPRR